MRARALRSGLARCWVRGPGDPRAPGGASRTQGWGWGSKLLAAGARAAGLPGQGGSTLGPGPHSGGVDGERGGGACGGRGTGGGG